MAEKPEITGIIRDEQGKFIKGHSGNPNGRPQGSVSIRDKIRQHLENNPDEVEKIVEHFVKTNRELMWQMLEGKPKQQMEVDVDKESIVELTKFFRGFADEPKESGDESSGQKSV